MTLKHIIVPVLNKFWASCSYKRYRYFKVIIMEKTVGVQRANTLKPYSQKTSQSNH